MPRAQSQPVKYYKFTLTYSGKKSSGMDNKIGPLVRKYSGKFDSNYHYENNETIVIITVEKKEDKEQLQKELDDPRYNFLSLESVVLTSMAD